MAKEDFGKPVVSGTEGCWPWAHDWTQWQPRQEVVDSVCPYADGKKRKVENIYRRRTCRACSTVDEYLYDCHVHEAEEVRPAA